MIVRIKRARGEKKKKENNHINKKEREKELMFTYFSEKRRVDCGSSNIQNLDCESLVGSKRAVDRK